jgi:sterol 3beta-glucosyltransferase
LRIAIIVFGSRGDAEPALALAFALTQRGHEAVVSVPEDLVDFGQSRRRSAELATELRTENGAMEAAKLIEQEAVVPA